jgi:hypothetical protein
MGRIARSSSSFLLRAMAQCPFAAFGRRSSQLAIISRRHNPIHQPKLKRVLRIDRLP